MLADDDQPVQRLYSRAYELIAPELNEEQRAAIRTYEEATCTTKDMLLENLRMGDDGGLGQTAMEFGPQLAQKEIRDWFGDLDDWWQALWDLAEASPSPNVALKAYLERATADWYSATNAVRRAAVFHFLGMAGAMPTIDDRKVRIGGLLIDVDGAATAEAHH